MKVLITGSAGFIGKNLIAAVPKDWSLHLLHHNKVFDQVPLQHMDLGIHLAGNGDPTLSVTNCSYDLDANVAYTLKLFDRFDFDKFIYFSSGAVYDGLIGAVNPLKTRVDPKLPYAISKLATEQYLKYFAKRGHIKELIIVRFFGAYGPHEQKRKIYTNLVRQFGINHKSEFTIRGDGENLINAMYVDDAIKAILQLVERMPNQGIIDLYAGWPTTILQLVNTVAEIFDINPEIKFEGETVEPIRFWSTDMAFPFHPETSLKDGLYKLKEWLIKQEEDN